MKLSENERDGAMYLLDGTKYLAAAAASALIALLLPTGKKKRGKKYVKNFKRVNKAVTGATETAALKWLEADVKKNPGKYIRRDKGLQIEQAEMIDI